MAISSQTVFGDGLIYLIRDESLLPNYHIFVGEPSQLRSVWGVLTSARQEKGRKQFR
ncbi:MAG: hypothetical protein P4L55_04220 [Syntrophobacteraceae bacterium]|nr:hypothetical protein [Syntrophobacteraceae bacterium]